MRLFGRASTQLERRLGYRFRRPELLELALTHRSYANERGLDGNYERLEFLGDAVLGLVVAEWLHATEPDRAEGELSKRMGHLVSARSLAAWARELGLGEHLRLGVGEERSGGRAKPSLLADVTEAILGAVYLDGGLAAARRLVVPFLATGLAATGRLRDAKTRLQEAVQSAGGALPEYRLVGAEGPDHDKRFTVEVRLAGRLAGRGSGRSKKLAEQRAAEEALLDAAAADAAPVTAREPKETA